MKNKKLIRKLSDIKGKKTVQLFIEGRGMVDVSHIIEYGEDLAIYPEPSKPEPSPVFKGKGVIDLNKEPETTK